MDIDGKTAFLVENAPPYMRTDHNPGTPPEGWTLDEFVRYEDMAGAGPAEQRVQEQDQDGIDAEVLFTGNGINLANNIVDDDAYHAVVRGYNDFLAKQYCAVDPDRLIGLGVIPRRGVKGAIAELEHCVEIGLKGLALSAYPSGGERPAAEDDAFWAAACDSGLAMCVHGGIPTRGGGDFLATRLTLPIGRRNCGASPLALAIDGVFDRFPKLKLFFGETDIGWIPFFMDQVDIFYRKGYHFQYLKKQGLKELDRPPTEILKEHTYWGFMEDRLGLELLARYGHMGLDHVMWESDFPHKPTSWPYSMDQIQRIFTGFDEEDMYPMVAGNAVRYFHLDAAAPSGR
jgi:predicted TIM-barrel fold metal-dependent hydrolase